MRNKPRLILYEIKMKRKKKVKVPVTAKKNKQHQTSNCDISITSAAADLKFLLCVDLVQISLRAALVMEILILRHIA